MLLCVECPGVVFGCWVFFCDRLLWVGRTRSGYFELCSESVIILEGPWRCLRPFFNKTKALIAALVLHWISAKCGHWEAPVRKQSSRECWQFRWIHCLCDEHN